MGNKTTVLERHLVLLRSVHKIIFEELDPVWSIEMWSNGA
jgi:hypothetical protein